MLRTPERYYRTSARLAERATTLAARAASPAAAALVVIQHQAASANEVTAATTAMLAEQKLRDAPTARLNPVAFTTGAREVEAMLSRAEVDWQFTRLVSSLVQDAGRAAQLADITTRTRTAHVRHLNLPSCSRCAVLAGRIYRYSSGFQRHPGCDCVMIPTTVTNDQLTYDPAQLARDGLVTGLSKADMKAVDQGADFGQVVNARSRTGGLRQSGEALTRAGRPTPAGIYRIAGDDRDTALALFAEYGYIR